MLPTPLPLSPEAVLSSINNTMPSVSINCPSSKNLEDTLRLFEYVVYVLIINVLFSSTVPPIQVSRLQSFNTLKYFL